MQRDSFVLPNTFRDSNEISLTRPSAPSIDDMDLDSESRHSIVRPVEPDLSLPPRFDPSNSNPIINKPLSRSIVRPHPNINDDDDDEEAAVQEQTSNERLINENGNALLEAAGYDSNKLAEVDADAAFALQLQQEEYSRDSLAANRQRFLPFQVEPDEESNPSIPVGLDPSQFGSDAEYAAYLQEQENRNRAKYRPPFPFFPIQQRSQPGSIQTSETEEGDNDPNSLVRFSSRRPPFPEDDDDDDGNPQMASAQAFLQFLANSGHPMREGFPAFLRRGRRTGNLQDTEEDFGPEDYERLLQLDDGIHKKKLSQHQINSIPEIKFHARINNTDEENKCGVCLELFEENQLLRQFPCKHVYHKECGDRWLKENNVCPICRKIPVQTQSTSHSRHPPHHQPRGTGGSRRPVISNRNPSNQSNNNNNNNNNNSSSSNNNHRRRPPASHHPS